MKKEFTLNEQIKIWLHYMAIIVGLNNYLHEFPLTSKFIDYSTCKVYDVLGVATTTIERKHIVKPFFDFCNSDSLYEHYWRFEKEINL